MQPIQFIKKDGFSMDFMEYAEQRGFFNVDLTEDTEEYCPEDRVSMVDAALEYLNEQEQALGSNERFILAEFESVVIVPVTA